MEEIPVFPFFSQFIKQIQWGVPKIGHNQILSHSSSVIFTIIKSFDADNK